MKVCYTSWASAGVTVGVSAGRGVVVVLGVGDPTEEVGFFLGGGLGSFSGLEDCPGRLKKDILSVDCIHQRAVTQ